MLSPTRMRTSSSRSSSAISRSATSRLETSSAPARRRSRCSRPRRVPATATASASRASTLASIALAQGDLEEAYGRLVDCLAAAEEVGFHELSAYALGLAAALALALDDPDTAATLLEAARERFGRIGGAPQAHEVERHARVAARVDELLEDPEPAFARGRDLRPDEAVAIAFALDTGRD